MDFANSVRLALVATLATSPLLQRALGSDLGGPSFRVPSLEASVSSAILGLDAAERAGAASGSLGCAEGSERKETTPFRLTGRGGAEPATVLTAKTESLLKIRVIAGPAAPVRLGGSGFNPSYGCISYDVTVAGMTVTTPLLAVGGGSLNCPQAPSSVVIDFSNRLVAGHDEVKVTLSDPRTDFLCQHAQGGGAGASVGAACPARPVFRDHAVTGSVEILTNQL